MKKITNNIKYIFNKELSMLFKNRKRTGSGHFCALQISTKQILECVTIFQNSYIQFLEHGGCDITVEYRLLLRTYFTFFTPGLGEGIPATSIDKRGIHQKDFCQWIQLVYHRLNRTETCEMCPQKQPIFDGDITFVVF